jgi:hypothetical protein
MSNVLTYACEYCHAGIGNFDAPIIKNHKPPSLSPSPGANITTSAYCSTCHNNSINSYAYSVNASVSHYGTNISLVKPTVNQTSMPRFGFMSSGDASSYNTNCNNCHYPSNPNYGNATLIYTAHTSLGTCNECHVNVNASDLHNGSLGMPQTFSCLGCHTTYASKYRAPNLTGTSMTSFTTCEICHGGGNGNQLLDTWSEHNIDRYQNGYIPAGPGLTDIVYLNGQTSLTVTKGTIVTVTSRINDTPGLASRVGGAEYYINTNPGIGKGTSMNAVDGQYDAVYGAWESVTGAIDTATLSDGTYNVYVRGMDIGKQWSSPKSATLRVRSLGYINGTVIDSITKAGLSRTIVSANTIVSATTNSTGFYSLMVPAGTYNLTAQHDPAYYPNMSVTVTAIINATVVQDIELVEKPKGTISGTVRNA